MYNEKIAEQMNLAAGNAMPREVLAVNWSGANGRIEIQVTESAFKQEFTDQGIKETRTSQNSGNWTRLSFITKSGAEVFTLEEMTGPMYRIIDGQLVEVKK
jgi:hypothetical protein